MTTRPTSPQDKKALSYARDRRPAYGESDKGARKTVPRRKAIENRHDRRKTDQALAAIPALDEAAAELVESSARHATNRIGGWRKVPDMVLGEYVDRHLRGREDRAGRKQASKARRQAQED